MNIRKLHRSVCVCNYDSYWGHCVSLNCHTPPSQHRTHSAKVSVELKKIVVHALAVPDQLTGSLPTRSLCFLVIYSVHLRLCFWMNWQKYVFSLVLSTVSPCVLSVCILFTCAKEGEESGSSRDKVERAGNGDTERWDAGLLARLDSADVDLWYE